MLPQNSFDAFLNEDASSRIENLEGISDTSIISENHQHLQKDLDEKTVAYKELKAVVESLPTHIAYNEAKKAAERYVESQRNLECLLNSVTLIRNIDALSSHHASVLQIKKESASELPALQARLQSDQTKLEELAEGIENSRNALAAAEHNRQERLALFQKYLDIQSGGRARGICCQSSISAWRQKAKLKSVKRRSERNTLQKTPHLSGVYNRARRVCRVHYRSIFMTVIFKP